MHLPSHFLPPFDQPISTSGSLPCAISLIIFFHIASSLLLIISLHILVFLLLPLPLKVFFSTPWFDLPPQGLCATEERFMCVRGRWWWASECVGMCALVTPHKMFSFLKVVLCVTEAVACVTWETLGRCAAGDPAWKRFLLSCWRKITEMKQSHSSLWGGDTWPVKLVA